MNKIPATLLTAFALLSFSSLFAQEAMELPKHPDDVLKFQVKFEGPDAAKVKFARAELHLTGAIRPEQSTFTQVLRGNGVPAASANTFNPEIKIPQNAATGDYLLQVYAETEGNVGQAQYIAGDQFQLHPFHIENPRTFTAPKITVKEQR